jgi:hypothetical protein
MRGGARKELHDPLIDELDAGARTYLGSFRRIAGPGSTVPAASFTALMRRL